MRDDDFVDSNSHLFSISYFQINFNFCFILVLNLHFYFLIITFLIFVADYNWKLKVIIKTLPCHWHPMEIL